MQKKIWNDRIANNVNQKKHCFTAINLSAEIALAVDPAIRLQLLWLQRER